MRTPETCKWHGIYEAQPAEGLYRATCPTCCEIESLQNKLAMAEKALEDSAKSLATASRWALDEEGDLGAPDALSDLRQWAGNRALAAREVLAAIRGDNK